MCTQPPEGCLFLLEFLVDKVVFVRNPCFADSSYKTCVKFEFLGMDPLEVCSEACDCIPQSIDNPTTEFHSGKSVLFPMNDCDVCKAECHFPICVTVYKTMPCGCLPTQIIMGGCRIDFHTAFAEARREFLMKPDTIGKRSIKELFPLTLLDGEETGTILLFIRISCFGKMIETKLQSDGGCISAVPTKCDKPAANTSAARNSKPWANMDEPCCCEPCYDCVYDMQKPQPPKFQQQQMTYQVQPQRCNFCNYAYESSDDNSCYCGGGRVTPSRVSEFTHQEPRNTQQYCLHLPQRYRKDYEEMGTNLNGNELRLKVPKEQGAIKKIGPEITHMQRPGAAAQGGGTCQPPCAFNQILLDVPGNEQQEASQFVYTAEGHNKEVIPTSVPKNPAVAQKVLHPNKDVFVFKVAKRASDGDRKNKLELELVTPKGPEKRGLPRYESRCVQYEEEPPPPPPCPCKKKNPRCCCKF